MDMHRANFYYEGSGDSAFSRPIEFVGLGFIVSRAKNITLL